jgi:hypothetical protein
MTTRRAVLVFAIMLCSAGVVIGQTEWAIHPDSPVIEPGPPGSWDDDKIRSGALHFDGSVYHLWYDGRDQAGVHADTGHATSSDGVEWTKDPTNPVLTRGAPGEWDDFWVYGTGVVHDGAQYHMWYNGFGSQTDIWQVGYATSPDGTVWTKHPDNPVLTPGPAGSWDSLLIGLGTVILDDGSYRMWYDGGDETARQVGYAESTDGVTWTKYPDPIVEVGTYPGAWDRGWVSWPYVVFDGTTYHMWYTGGHITSTYTHWSIGYAYSGDGIEWTKHGESFVLTGSEGLTQSGPVHFDGSTFHMWYSQRFNSDGMWRIMYATSDCCTSLDRQVIPAVAYAAGAEGSFYETTLDLNNAGVADAEVRFLWMPRGASNTDPFQSEPITVAAGESLRWANVLAEVFDLEPNAVGALAIKSTSEDLLAVARVANTPQEPGAGSFGQPLETIRTLDCTGQNEKRRLLFATEHSDTRYNVGCFNASDESAQVSFELYRSDGTLLGTESLDLMPWGNDQLNRIFDPYRPVTGYVDYWSDLPQGRIYCYGSLLDNVTSDPTTIPPR